MKKLIFAALMTIASSMNTYAAIGDLSADLVFTPITPCRIVDTRGAGAGGVIPAGTKRDFVAWVGSGGVYTSQGGKAGTCGLPASSDIAAVSVNLLVIAPAAEGWIAAWPYGEVQPLVSNLNFKAGDVLANSAILKIGQAGASKDFSVYTTSTTHFVADVTGYYSKPVATALQCVETESGNVSILAGSTGTSFTPVCSAGYTITGGGCTSNIFDGRVVSSRTFVSANYHFCAWKNEGAGAMTGVAYSTCCRIPGR